MRTRPGHHADARDPVDARPDQPTAARKHLAEQLPAAQLLEIPGLGHALPRAVQHLLAAAVLMHTARRPP